MSDLIAAVILFVIIYLIFTYTKEHLIGSYDISNVSHILNPYRTVTLYYANWCGGCHQFKNTWEQIKSSLKASGTIFKEINDTDTASPGILKYPTILLIDERGRSTVYNGDLNYAQVRQWITSPNFTQ
jgi:hypothetical protein